MTARGGPEAQERESRIVAMWADGHQQRGIAAMEGISPARVRQVLIRAVRRRARAGAFDLRVVPSAAWTSLLREGWMTVADVARRIGAVPALLRRCDPCVSHACCSRGGPHRSVTPADAIADERLALVVTLPGFAAEVRREALGLPSRAVRMRRA